MKIIFTGAQGVGKTTLMNKLHDLMPSFEVYPSFARELSACGLMGLNKENGTDGQRINFDVYLYHLICKDNYLIDRCSLDQHAYSRYLFLHDKLSMEQMLYEERRLADLAQAQKEDEEMFIFYIPIEFELQDDGVRSIDPEYQKFIDNSIKADIEAHGFVVTTLRGTVEERMDQIMKVIGEGRRA